MYLIDVLMRGLTSLLIEVNNQSRTTNADSITPCKNPGETQPEHSAVSHTSRRPAATVPTTEKKGDVDGEESEGLISSGNGDSTKGTNSPPDGRTSIRSSSSSDLKAKEFV